MLRRDLLKLLAGGAIAGLAGCQRTDAAATPQALLELDGIALADLINSGNISALDAVQASLAQIEALNPRLNAVTFHDSERSLAQAGQTKGLLAGVPTLLKDLNAYADMPWTRGSRLFADARASESDQSDYTNRLLGSGSIVLGKTNTPEFGLLPTTEPALHGPTRNPWNLNHSAGGSSGGAAAAVAARLVPFAQCGDGGGSIRIPAALCGVFGLKPSRGRFPDQGYGVQAWPISIRHVVSRSVRDSALVLALTERTDAASDMLPVGFIEPSRVRPLRIAITMNSLYGAPDAEVIDAVTRTASVLETLGHQLEIVEATPLADAAFAEDFLTLWQATASGIADQVRRLVGSGNSMSGLLEPFTLGLAAGYAKRPKNALGQAQAGLANYAKNVRSFLGTYDAWLTPVTPQPAPAIGQMAPDLDFDVLLERVSRFAAYTPLHNAAGTPAMSVPAGLSANGLPIGVQLAGDLGAEATLFELAYQLERAQPWKTRLPPTHTTPHQETL
ncbi:MAG: amidase [Pseudomonadota bacterium]